MLLLTLSLARRFDTDSCAEELSIGIEEFAFRIMLEGET